MSQDLIAKLNGGESKATKVKLREQELTFVPPSRGDIIRIYGALEQALNDPTIIEVFKKSFPEIENPEQLEPDVKLDMFGLLANSMT